MSEMEERGGGLSTRALAIGLAAFLILVAGIVVGGLTRGSDDVPESFGEAEEGMLVDRERRAERDPFEAMSEEEMFQATVDFVLLTMTESDRQSICLFYALYGIDGVIEPIRNGYHSETPEVPWHPGIAERSFQDYIDVECY